MADEIRETFSSDGHLIDKAVDLHSAFRHNKHPQSSMVRNMVLQTINNRAPRLNVGVISVSGGGCDLQLFNGNVEMRCRVLKASKDSDTDAYVIVSSSDNIFVIEDAEPDSMFKVERWVFAYTVDEFGMITDIFAAQVIGKTKAKVPQLLLGPVTMLGSAIFPSPDQEFRGADEDDLDGFDADEGDDEAV